MNFSTTGPVVKSVGGITKSGLGPGGRKIPWAGGRSRKIPRAMPSLVGPSLASPGRAEPSWAEACWDEPGWARAGLAMPGPGCPVGLGPAGPGMRSIFLPLGRWCQT